MSNLETYREQAAAAHHLAMAAALPNVRARYLESASVWARLADRAERLEQMQVGPDDDSDW